MIGVINGNFTNQLLEESMKIDSNLSLNSYSEEIRYDFEASIYENAGFRVGLKTNIGGTGSANIRMIDALTPANIYYESTGLTVNSTNTLTFDIARTATPLPTSDFTMAIMGAYTGVLVVRMDSIFVLKRLR